MDNKKDTHLEGAGQTLKNKHYLISYVPLDNKHNFEKFQQNMRSRSAAAADSFAKAGFKPFVGFIYDTDDVSIVDALKNSSFDLNFGSQLIQHSKGVLEFHSTTHPFVMHTEIKMTFDEIERLQDEVASLSGLEITMKIGQTKGLPIKCMSCSEGKVIEQRLIDKDETIARDERLLQNVENQVTRMDKMMHIMQTINPDIGELEHRPKFDEMPSRAALDIFIARINMAFSKKNVEDLNDAWDNTAELTRYKNVSPKDINSEFTKLTNQALTNQVQIGSTYLAAIDEGGDAGADLSEDEYELINSQLSDGIRQLNRQKALLKQKRLEISGK